MNERQALGSVILVGALIILPGLCVQQLESGDETRVAGIAAEMFINGDYLIPRLNGTPFLEYPPLFYWSVSFCYGLFGITDFSAKLPSVLSAVGCGVLLFFLARKMRYSITGALLSSVMLMTSAQFFGNSRKCTVDMMLAFFILFSVYQFYCLVIATARGKSSLHFLLFILGIAGGIYTKGLLGLCIPLAALGSWLVLGDLVKHRIAWKHYILLFLGAFFSLVLGSAWYVLLYRAGGELMFNTAFFVNNFGRFTGSQGDHAESFLYYFIKLPTLFFPWLPLLPFAIRRNIRKVRDSRQAEFLLPLCFLLVPFLALCCASGKRIVYLLPLYAPCALLCGQFLSNLPPGVRLFRRKIRIRHPRLFHPGICRYGLPVVFSCFIAADIGYCIYSNRQYSLRPLFKTCMELEKNGKQLVLGNPAERTRGAAFFYLRHSVEERKKEARIPPDEFWIFRSRKQSLRGTRFADHHYLLKGES